MDKKIFGLLGGQIKKNVIAELHELFGDTELRHFEVAPDTLSSVLKSESFDALHVDMSLRLKVMPLMSKTSPEARLGGGVDLILRMPNGKLFGHNTEVAGFSYLLDRYGIDVAGKKCLILGNGLDAAAVYGVAENRGAGDVILITHDKYSTIEQHGDADIIFLTSRAERISVPSFTAGKIIVDIRTDRINSEYAMPFDASPEINGYAMAAAQVKLARELATGIAIPESELLGVTRRIVKKRTSIMLTAADHGALAELGRALARRLDRKYYDLNSLIERMNGKSIEQISEENGANELLRMQLVAAEWAGKQTGAVITFDSSLIFRSEELLPKLKKNGIIVYRSIDDSTRGQEAYCCRRGGLALGNDLDTDAAVEKIVDFLGS